MAKMNRFDLDKDTEELQWMNKPQSIKYGVNGGSGLNITPDKDTDFWQKTYYDPLLVADNGHLLYQDVGNKTMVETTFHLKECGQFDQAGLMVRKDEDCWIKTGIEFVDGRNNMSCVVTNTYSDWSTEEHPSGDLSIRIYRQGASFVVEVKHGDSDWRFIRICHLNIGEDEPIKMGLFSCAPQSSGGSVKFDYLKYERVEKYHHSA